MDVLVTGETGDVGRTAVARPVSHGHRVRVVGRTEGVAMDGAEYRACDINGFDRLRDQVRGVQAIVHLGAVRHPSLAPGAVGPVARTAALASERWSSERSACAPNGIWNTLSRRHTYVHPRPCPEDQELP
jgi:uncharacterized protein YbjT (DUF2867 family)